MRVIKPHPNHPLVFVPDPPPDCVPRDKFMPGDKVREILSNVAGATIFRVKHRFAIDDMDYIKLEDVGSGLSYTLPYYPLANRLELVTAADRTPPQFIN